MELESSYLELLNLCCARAAHKPFEPANLMWGKIDLTAILAFAYFLTALPVDLGLQSQFHLYIAVFIILPDAVTFERLRKKHIWRIDY